MYSSANKLASSHAPADPNQFKAISVKDGSMKLEFDEKDGIIKLTTAAGNIINIDDKAKSITIEDASNSNKVILSKDGILLDSSKDIILKAAANIYR
jgi:hypothetical protein